MRRDLPTETALKELHARRDAALARISGRNLPRSEGAGIVMVAGGLRHFASAWVNICWLQDVVQTQLPFQVWHLGDTELNQTMKELLRSRDVQLIDAFAVRERHPVRTLGGWECKPYALLHCGFRHAILLDADAMPLVDPAEWLEWPEYGETGVILWPDNQSHLPESPVWRLFDVPYREELEIESGQLVVDTQRCWRALNLAMHYCEWSDIYFQYVYGDKEAFHFAWRFLEQPYSIPEGRPDIVYCERDTPFGRRRMTLALEQNSFDGTPVVQHRTGGKWAAFGENPIGSRSDIDAFAQRALQHLREKWDGRLSAPAQSQVNFNPASLCAPVRARLTELGHEEHILTLNPDGSVTGTDSPIDSWHLDVSGTLSLCMHGAQSHWLRLSDGIWCGEKMVWEKSRTILEAL